MKRDIFGDGKNSKSLIIAMLIQKMLTGIVTRVSNNCSGIPTAVSDLLPFKYQPASYFVETTGDSCIFNEFSVFSFFRI